VLHVVTAYKHLGGIVNIREDPFQECVHRASSAMSAYAPIAVKVFGSNRINISQRLSFMSSLVLSRLLFNVHVLVMFHTGLRKLNGPYMRTLRRILGVPRFEKSELSDYQVRESLGQPSIDCLVLRQRLM